MASPTTPPTVGARIASIAVSIAAAFVILGASIVPFLTPQWIHGEQVRSGATVTTEQGFLAPGVPAGPARWYADEVVHDLLLGGDFAIVTGRGVPLLDAREVVHMEQVRTVFQVVGLLVIAGVLIVAASSWRSRRSVDARRAWWRAVAWGARGLAVFMAVVGVLSVVAFDAAFELFHELLFPPGSFSFDPATERLVQLFPDQFWSDTALVLGLLALVLSILVASVASRRAHRLDGSIASDRGATASASLTPRSAP